jgi:hypothetical protein
MYEQFENELQQLLSNDNALPTTSLRTVVPELLHAMEISHGSLSTQMEGLIQSNAKLEWAVVTFSDEFHEVMTGHAAIRLHIDRTCGNDDPTSVQNADRLHTAALHVSPTPPTELTAVLPQYRMSRYITSVEELWREFYHGLNGGPSIVSLEQEFGKKWHSSAADSKFFSKRKFIIEMVLSVADTNGVSTEEAIRMLDEFRGNRTLDWLSKNRKTYCNTL